jgi:hypothetical protein
MTDKEKVSFFNRRYRENNKEKIKQIQDSYYKNNRDKRILNATNWRLNNKEKALETRRKYIKTPKGRLNSIKASAKTRKIEFNISDELALEILNNNCYYCGDKIVVGIDRLDNSLGYLETNIVACCEMCNYMKRIYTKEQFIIQCKKITINHS